VPPCTRTRNHGLIEVLTRAYMPRWHTHAPRGEPPCVARAHRGAQQLWATPNCGGRVHEHRGRHPSCRTSGCCGDEQVLRPRGTDLRGRGAPVRESSGDPVMRIARPAFVKVRYSRTSRYARRNVRRSTATSRSMRDTMVSISRTARGSRIPLAYLNCQLADIF